MLRLSLPRLDERGRGAPAACADLICADPALVPMIESLAVRGQLFALGAIALKIRNDFLVGAPRLGSES